ncbi:CBS domain-containing protein [Acidothermaceae bacterium B102]|nr:CBS domain-containing protein [Acidothermaceae bacterium B102]
MYVSEIMTKASITESASEPIRAAAARMWAKQTGSLLVMDGDTLIGIITERDVMKCIARGLDVETTPVSAVMTRTVQTVSPYTTVNDAARQMAARWIRHLPVTEDGVVVGMVSQRDLVGIFAALTKEPDSIELASDELVRERRLARIESGDLD